MPPHFGKFVAYYRVSTERQHKSGLGKEAQVKAVQDYLNGGTWDLIGEFAETESGKKSDRPKLHQALAMCRKHKAKLIIAKLDRLARNVHFISGLMEQKVDFVACDMPNAQPFQLHIYAAMAEEERRAISARTKAALQAAKRRGVKLGRTGAELLAPRFKAEAQARADELAPLIRELQAEGYSLREIADELTKRNVPTQRSGKWHHQLVRRILQRGRAS
jgi:DNA invertase Pin-like site-specific DNA recombinase